MMIVILKSKLKFFYLNRRMDDSFKHLEKDLESLIEASRELGIKVNDYKNEHAVLDSIKTISKCLKELDSSKDNFKDVLVPIQVFK
jgi:hypothetical protein